MGSIKPVSGEAAIPPHKPAVTVKGAAPTPSGTKPPADISTGNEPLLSKTQSFPSLSPMLPLSSPGVNVQELYKQTAALLGLPQDTLSFVLISAIRCFSLSPDAALLSRLRADLLASGAASAPKTGKEKAALEAKVLAAVAAADKGLRLSPEALEEYAAAMEPGAWFSGGGGRGSPEKKDSSEREEPPDGEELGELYLKANQSGEKRGKEGLLSWLNRLPGGNGQGWAVFPFKLTIGGVELRVSVRLLIKGSSFFSSIKDASRGCLIVDIEGPARNWRFILERNGGGASAADITVYPGEAADIKALEKDAKTFFGGTEIRVRGSGEAPSLTERLYQEALPSVDERV